MGRRTINTLFLSLITTLITIVIGNLIKWTGDIALSLLDPVTKALILPYLSYLSLGAIFVLFLIMVNGALHLGSFSYPIKDAIALDTYRLPTWKRFLGFSQIWSQLRFSIVSGLVVVSAIFYLGFTTSFGVIHWLLLFFVISDILLQFYVATGLVRNNLSKSILQLIKTLASQIELSLAEALGHSQSCLRLGIYTYSKKDKKLHLRYSYQMKGDPDFNMTIGINQGVEGRVYKEGIPKLKFPFDKTKLDYTKVQQEKIPSKIKWKLAFPLWQDHKPYGVLVMDCDRSLPKIWLDKFLDFTHAFALSIAILLSEFPSKEIQDAFE